MMDDGLCDESEKNWGGLIQKKDFLLRLSFSADYQDAPALVTKLAKCIPGSNLMGN